MHTSLSHLPQNKQQEILRIVEIIKEVASPEKIILFGSYAKGTWVEDQYFENGIRYEYISDYDFLVVTKGREEKDYVLADKIINRSHPLTKVAVNPIIHEINYINEGLSIGQYFFTDIIREGIELYDTKHLRFAEPRELIKEEQKEIAQNYYDIWFNRGSEFLIDANHAADRKSFNKSAFELHQATECFYNTVLLVFTGYKPKTHSLDKLRQHTKSLSQELFSIFPSSTENRSETHLFDLLKRGYIDARYKNDYVITEEELTTLIKRVQKMQHLVQTICTHKISSLAKV